MSRFILIMLLTFPLVALAETTYLHCSGADRSGKTSARAVTLIKKYGKVYLQWGREKPREMLIEGDFYKWRENEDSALGQVVTLNRITKTFAHFHSYNINGNYMFSFYKANCAITKPL